MNSNYPNAIDSFQTKENEQGATYDPQETTVQFAEDINKTNSAIQNVQEVLGTNPEAGFETVGDRLDKINSIAEQPVIFTIAPSIQEFQISGRNITVSLNDCQFTVGTELVFLNAQDITFEGSDSWWSLYINTDYEYEFREGTFNQVISYVDQNVLIPILSMYVIDYDDDVDFDDVIFSEYLLIKSKFNTFPAFTYNKTVSNSWRVIKYLGSITGLTPRAHYLVTISCAKNTESGSYGYQDTNYSTPFYEIKGGGSAQIGATAKMTTYSDMSGTIDLYYCAKGATGSATQGEMQISCEKYTQDY